MQGRDQFVTVKACKGLLKLRFPVEKCKGKEVENFRPAHPRRRRGREEDQKFDHTEWSSWGPTCWQGLRQYICYMQLLSQLKLCYGSSVKFSSSRFIKPAQAWNLSDVINPSESFFSEECQT